MAVEPTTGFLGTLGVDGRLLIAQLVNFAIVFFVVWKWIYTPLVKILDERATRVKEGLAKADEAKQQLAHMDEERKNLLRQASAEAKELIQQAKREAAAEQDRLRKEAEAVLQREAEQAKKRLAEEREAQWQALKGELSDFVVSATERVVPQVLDEKRHHDLIKKALQELESERV